MSTRLSSSGSGGGGAGTVTSVDVAAPAPLSASGGPVTASGTVTLAWATGQTQNRVLASPDGSSGAVALRALVAADVPALDAAKVTSGTFPAARIGSVNPSTLTGSGTVPLAALSGITTSQLDAAAAITSAQIAALATSKLTGTLAASQLAVSAPTSGQLGGLTTANLSASSALVAGQIASVNPSVLTGSGQAPVAALPTSAQLAALSYVLDGGGNVILTGVAGDLICPFACTLTGCTLLGDQSGSIVVDVWKTAYAGYPPTVANTITASALPTIGSATKSQDLALTGWTTTLAAGDVIRFNVNSVTTLTRCAVILNVLRT